MGGMCCGGTAADVYMEKVECKIVEKKSKKDLMKEMMQVRRATGAKKCFVASFA